MRGRHLPLDDALRLLVRRGRLTHDLPGDGAMLSVMASEAQVRAAMCALGLPLDVAALNASQQVVVSGARANIDALTARLDAQGLRWRALRISHAFHSALIEPALVPFGEALAGVRFGTARCSIVTNLSGKLAAPGELAQTGYWLRQMREPVRFADGLRTLLAQGVTHVIEIGPHPVLLGLAAEDLSADAPVQWLPSLRRDAPAWTDLFDGLQRLFVAGAPVDFAGVDRGLPRARVGIPLTPFQRRRHWVAHAPRQPTPTGHGSHVWQSLGIALERQSAQAPIGVDVTGYGQRGAALERLTVAHATAVLRASRLFTVAGDSASVDEVRQRLGARDTYRHLLERWLQRLVARGALRADGARYHADQPLPDPDLPACEAAVQSALADNPTLLAYLANCGRLLPAVIADRESPLETLFPGGSFELAEGIYQRSTQMRYINALAASAVEAIVAARAPESTLRVLEIGAGTGSTTAAIVPLLPAKRTTYCYSDVTSAFFDRARDKFAAHPFMRYAEFDLERNAAVQGLAPASFDLVIAANVVHATRNLRDALRAVKNLLAPGGVLLLVESTNHLAWYDMSTSLIEGWQKFHDDLRTDNPLLPAPTWLRALREAGFDAVDAWPRPDNEAIAMGQQVIAAWLAGDGALAASPPMGPSPVVVTGQNAHATGHGDVEATALRARLQAATDDERRELLRGAVCNAVAAVLRLGATELPGRHDRLMDLGMDSLMAVQLRNRIGHLLGLTRPLPSTLMFDQPTIEALATYLQPLLEPSTVEPAAAAPAAAAAATATAAPLGVERVRAMSDAEVEALLLERLDKR